MLQWQNNRKMEIVMDQYKVLLVDDEEEVIRVIRKKINWEEIGFSVVGYANNGVKALELMEELQPDVVMTDIKMPFMDGVELSRRIRREYPAVKLLFFTGFDEFEYAKSAIHLEVEDYILKPVNSVELTKVFTQLKGKMDQEIDEKRNVETLRKYYLESLPLLQTNLYISLIEGKVSEKEISHYLSDYQLSFSGPYFCCLVIHTSTAQVPENMDPLLIAASVHKQAEERLAEKWQAKCFSHLKNTVLISQLETEDNISELTDDCDRFCKYAKSILGAVVTIGIGSLCDGLLSLSKSYYNAREAVSYRVIYGVSRAINRNEIVPQESDRSVPASDTALLDLFKMIQFGSEQDVEKAVDRYLDQMAASGHSLSQHHVELMELISMLYRFAVNHEISLEDFEGDIRDLYSSLLDMEPTALRIWMTDCSYAFRDQLIRARNRSTKSLISRAEDYVRHNFGEEDLSLDRICEVLGLSNSYFSSIFKKETGKSFIQYLTDYRMEQAARQLIETDEKSYIIAQKVGYTDPNYFSYVFKRRFGVSPSKYRREHLESEDEISET